MSACNCPTASTQTSVAFRAETILVSTLFTIALGITAATLPAQSSEMKDSEVKVQPAKSVQVAQSPSLPNGTYLYGQAAKAEQIGRTYLVLQVRDRSVTGAIYEPASSFDCVQGTLQANRLALTVTNSYEQTQSPYGIALQTNSRVASAANPTLVAVKLAGYHRIQTVSDNDRRLLSTCEAKLAAI